MSTTSSGPRPDGRSVSDVSGDVVVITGGNRGLGLATGRQLRGLGATVVLGSRDAERGAAAAGEIGSEHVVLDVSDDRSVDAAASQIQDRYGRLDVLINNAGIFGPARPLAEVEAEDAREVFEVNVFGAIRATHAFTPILRSASNPRIVFVTSGVGSFGRIHDTDTIEFKVPPNLYAATKAAMTMLAVQYARALPDMRVNVADPGYTATDMNRGLGGGQTLEEGTEAILTLATLDHAGPTGTLIDRHGPMPW